MVKLNEEIINFAWKHGRIPIKLITVNGFSVEVLKLGDRNFNSGPDFLFAKIKTNDAILVGNIEVHVKTSDWFKHNHHNDKAFESVILHLVYENDIELNKIPDGQLVVELKKYISKDFIDKYSELVSSLSWIPCEKNLEFVKKISIKPWLLELINERLSNKTKIIKEILAKSNMDWENSFFRLLASNFGFKLNNNAFLLLAESLPIKYLMKHSNNTHQIEALLFGQSGLLKTSKNDEYSSSLRKEYDFLAMKYNLKPIDPRVWKFMRTRPGNFPTIRISQLAHILVNINELLSIILSPKMDYKRVFEIFKVSASEYWTSHYNFNKIADIHKVKNIGQNAIEGLIINTVIPFIFMYGDFHDNEENKTNAINILKQIKPEDNSIIRKWNALNINPDNSLESQALIELYNSYCVNKKCLLCSIGATLLLDAN